MQSRIAEDGVKGMGCDVWLRWCSGNRKLQRSLNVVRGREDEVPRGGVERLCLR